jgi:hypothetical protein
MKIILSMAYIRGDTYPFAAAALPAARPLWWVSLLSKFLIEGGHDGFDFLGRDFYFQVAFGLDWLTVGAG